jgi:hypothetical protein
MTTIVNLATMLRPSILSVSALLNMSPEEIGDGVPEEEAVRRLLRTANFLNKRARDLKKLAICAAILLDLKQRQVGA